MDSNYLIPIEYFSFIPCQFQGHTIDSRH